MSLFNIFNIAGSGMSAESVRLDTVASNLANADTPGYLARDIDFRAALAAASSQGSPLQPSATGAGDPTAAGATAGGGLSTQQFLKYRVPLAPSLDGNTVDSQLEESKFAQNTVRFQAALTFLENRFSELTTAITGQ